MYSTPPPPPPGESTPSSIPHRGKVSYFLPHIHPFISWSVVPKAPSPNFLAPFWLDRVLYPTGVLPSPLSYQMPSQKGRSYPPPHGSVPRQGKTYPYPLCLEKSSHMGTPRQNVFLLVEDEDKGDGDRGAELHALLREGKRPVRIMLKLFPVIRGSCLLYTNIGPILDHITNVWPLWISLRVGLGLG